MKTEVIEAAKESEYPHLVQDFCGNVAVATGRKAGVIVHARTAPYRVGRDMAGEISWQDSGWSRVASGTVIKITA